MSNKKTNPDLVRRDSWKGLMRRSWEGLVLQGEALTIRSRVLGKKNSAFMEKNKQAWKELDVGKWGERVT